MRLSDVQHQERALAILRRALASGRTHHAYLFTGPEGVGKERAAVGLAARLMCQDAARAPDADACGVCNSCRMIAAGGHPELHLVYRELNRQHPEATVRKTRGLFLVVDVVRHFVIGPAGVRPTQSPRRVFIIRDAERMNEEAQNALLKTLEEPPGATCLILVTASAERLLPTIRSRCQVIPFGLLPPAFVAAQLCKQADLTPPEAELLAALSGGRLGVALAWQRHYALLERLPEIAGLLRLVWRGGVSAFGKAFGDLGKALAATAQESDTADEADTAADGDDTEDADGTAERDVSTDAWRAGLKLILLVFAALLRDVLVQQAGAPTLARLAPLAEIVAELHHHLPPDAVAAALAAVAEAEEQLDRNVAVPLVGERLAIALLGEAPVARSL